VYCTDFIGIEEADKLFAAFQNLKWAQQAFNTPRKYVWMGIPPRQSYVPRQIDVTEWTQEAMRVKALVEEKTGYCFDSLSLNLYRDNRDSIDWHFDGEHEGLWGFPVASVSLGAVRRFKWRSIKDGLTTTQPLAHGSLLVMPPGFQRDYLHALLKQQKTCGERINLTFRRMVAH
jgi:alkylated DNA repair dioxygenase AlkB